MFSDHVDHFEVTLDQRDMMLEDLDYTGKLCLARFRKLLLPLAMECVARALAHAQSSALGLHESRRLWSRGRAHGWSYALSYCEEIQCGRTKIYVDIVQLID